MADIIGNLTSANIDGSVMTRSPVDGNLYPQGPKGDAGNGIINIELTSSVGLVDTYTIYFDDGTTTTFTVTNGQNGTNGVNGKGLEFNWQGTQLGVRVEGTQEYTYVNLKGQDGYTPVKGTDYFTASEIADIESDILSQVETLKKEIVQTLPSQDIDPNTIYLVPKQSASQGDVYDEYLYINNAWEHIGSTEVDLTNYYTKTEVNTLQYNMETEIINSGVVVSPTEPTTDRKKVWLQKGNGIDDKTFVLNENNIYEEFVQSDELFTTDGATDGKYLKSDGEEMNNSDWHITKFIKVKANKRYVICVDPSVNLGNNASICFYNSSKTFIKGGAFSNYTYRIILTPQNTEYVKISYSNTNVNSISFKPMEIAYYEYEGYTSTYGTLRDTKCIIKGNIVTFSCRLDVTTAISNGNQLITGLPRSFVNHIGLMAYDNVGPGYYNFSFNTGNIQYNTSSSPIPIDRSLRIVFTYILGDIFTIS